MYCKVLQHAALLPLASPVAVKHKSTHSGNSLLVVAHDTTCGTVGRFFPFYNGATTTCWVVAAHSHCERPPSGPYRAPLKSTARGTVFLGGGVKLGKVLQ